MKNIVLMLYSWLAFTTVPPPGEFDGLHTFVDPQILGSGKVQVFEYKTKEDRVYRVGAELVDAPCETVWNILRNPEKLGDAMTYLEYQKVVSPAASWEQDVSGEMIIEGRFAMEFFPAQYTIRMNFDGPGKWRKWRTLTPEEVETYNRSGVRALHSSGLIKDLSGFDHLESFGKTSRTVYYYAMDVNSTIPLPEHIKRGIHEEVFVRHMALIKKIAESEAAEPGQGSEDKAIEDQN